MRNFLILMMVCLGLGSCVVGARKMRGVEPTGISASYFAVGGVGYGGTMSPGERALRETLKQPDARRRLVKAFEQGGVVAQLYALVGLRKLDGEKFGELFARVSDLKRPIHVMNGCIGSQKAVGDVARAIREGRYDVEFERFSKAEETILMTPLFAMGRITDAGVFSDGEMALREILRRPKAQQRLYQLLYDATPEGQLYALLGIRQVNRKAFAMEEARYRDSGTKVRTMDGCNVSEERMGTVVRKIAAGEYRVAAVRR